MNQLPNTRHSLILRLADASDREAWLEFAEIYETAIFRFARKCGLQACDAEDVTQQVLEATFAKAADWRPQGAGHFRGWVYRVTRNLAARRANEKRRSPSQLIGEADDATVDFAVGGDASEEFDYEFRRAQFHWAAARVKGRVTEVIWAAFWATAVEGSDAERVARGLGVPRSAVYVAKCRVMRLVKEEVRAFNERSARLPYGDANNAV